ncbi:MAG: hypothetical protein ABJ059_00825, partial [Hyphomicrobiales bacterium]
SDFRVWFGVFIFSRFQTNNQLPEIGTQNRPIWATSSQNFRVGFGFLDFDCDDSFIGQDNPELPRANENIVFGKKS